MRTNAIQYGLPVLLLMLAAGAAAQTKKDFRYTVAPGATVSIINNYGPITVHAGNARQVSIATAAHSDKVEVDAGQTGNRIELRTHALQRAGENEERVDYEVTLPADTNLTIRCMNGAVSIEHLRGDISVENEMGRVEIHDLSNSHLRVHTIGAPVVLTNLSNGSVDVVSLSGDVTMSNVAGPKISVSSTRGNIRFDGDVGQNADYSFTNNSGDIDFTVPASASMDITARSMTGSVQNDFPLQQKAHTSFVPQPGRSFTGTSNSGSSTVELRSFSGKIRVKKR